MSDPDEDLEWLAQPVEVLRFDPIDSVQPRLRLFFDLVADDPPGASLSEIRVAEAGEAISVLVLARTLEGMLPDGAFAGSKLVSCLACVQVELLRPVGSRRVIDAITGRSVNRLDRDPVVDPEQGNLDHKLASVARDQGCPLWRSFDSGRSHTPA